MDASAHKTFTAFIGAERIASGTIGTLSLAVHRCLQKRPNAMPLVFDDETGNPVELDLRGTRAEMAARYKEELLPEPPAPGENLPPAPGRGRPRLGVTAREVTLLPEHWDWLAAQPGGASVALRKLVHEARQQNADRDRRRQVHERTYKVMLALAGNLPGFEEASRALFAGEAERLAALANAWPADIGNYILQLATSAASSPPAGKK